MLTRDDWSRLSGRLTLDVTALELLPDLEARLLDVRRRSAERGTDLSLAERWSQVTREALSSEAVVVRRPSPSTLVAAAPATADAALEEQAGAEAIATGASLRAPIYRAVDEAGPHWTMYRRWLETAPELDGGELRAVAYANPAFAVREAIVLVRPSARFRYDDETLSLVLSEGEPEIELDVESLVFMGLMNGRLPDHVLAVALEEAVARLSRLVRYRDELGGLPEARVRFAGTRPVVLVGDRLVVDPAGESFLASGARRGQAAGLVRAAVEDPLRTSCTCDEPRRPRVTLRPRAEVFSFDSDRLDEEEILYEPAGSSHCLVYELACGHAAARPSRSQWEAAGWSLERCRGDWEANPVHGRLLAAEAESWLSRSVLVWGVEVAAIAASVELASGLARRLGFQGGSVVTLFAPTANVLFVTNEESHDEPALRDAFERGRLAGLLEHEGLPPGPVVGFLASTASSAAPLAVEVEELAVGGAAVLG